MTWLDNICEVCGRSPVIGVAGTSIPYSCAFCAECAAAGADPNWVLSHLIDDIAGGDLNRLHPAARKSLRTWHDGNYITIEEWALVRPARPTPEGFPP